MPRSRVRDGRARRVIEELALEELDRIRAPVMEELERLARRPDYYRGEAPDLCCRREHNRMRISPLEARAIARAFRSDPGLAGRLPRVLTRLESELRGLADNDERQNFECPLLEDGRCLVHAVAKPIGCAAWHPPAEGEDVRFTKKGWRAFRERDALNDRLYGELWKLRVIPLWLRRVFAGELAKSKGRATLRRGRRRPSRSGGSPQPRTRR